VTAKPMAIARRLRTTKRSAFSPVIVAGPYWLAGQGDAYL
jgi:hypothetical protein